MMGNMGRLVRHFLQPYWKWILLAILLTFLSTVASLPTPLIIRYLVDQVLPARRFDLLSLVFVLILGTVFMARLVSSALRYNMTYLGQRVIFHVRHELFAHMQRLSLGFYDRHQTGRLMARIIDDVNVIQEIVSSGFVRFFTDLFTVLVAIGIMLYVNGSLALITIAILPLYVLNHKLFARRTRETGRAARRKMEEIVGNLEERISGVRVVKSFVKEQFESQVFLRKLREQFQLALRLGLLNGMLTSIATLLSGVGAALVLWYGGRQVLNQAISLGDLLAFYSYTGYVYGPIINLVMINAMIQRVSAAVDRIFEVLDTEPGIIDVADAVFLPADTPGMVRFDRVGLSYEDGQWVLQDINLTVQPGMKVALVGPSGAGKSSLVNLIPRLYETRRGTVSIDGHEVQKLQLYSLRMRIGVVPQEPILFTGTIGDNIRYGNLEATDEQVIKAAKMAQIHAFIEELPDGYDTLIGEKGIQLSGGQKQRVAIARALLTDPRILILDDSASALDAKTESLIWQTLNQVMQGRTTFLIAHKLSSVLDADLICVLNNGRIVEQGTHRQLLQQGGLYSRLYQQQFRALRETVATPMEM